MFLSQALASECFGIFFVRFLRQKMTTKHKRTKNVFFATTQMAIHDGYTMVYHTKEMKASTKELAKQPILNPLPISCSESYTTSSSCFYDCSFLWGGFEQSLGTHRAASVTGKYISPIHHASRSGNLNIIWALAGSLCQRSAARSTGVCFLIRLYAERWVGWLPREWLASPNPRKQAALSNLRYCSVYRELEANLIEGWMGGPWRPSFRTCQSDIPD